MTKPSAHSIVVMAEHSDNPAIQQALKTYNEAFNALAMLIKLSDADGLLEMLNSQDSYDRIKAAMELRKRHFECNPEAARQWMISAHPGLFNPDGSPKKQKTSEDDK